MQNTRPAVLFYIMSVFESSLRVRNGVECIEKFFYFLFFWLNPKEPCFGFAQHRQIKTWKLLCYKLKPCKVLNYSIVHFNSPFLFIFWIIEPLRGVTPYSRRTAALGLTPYSRRTAALGLTPYCRRTTSLGLALMQNEPCFGFAQHRQIKTLMYWLKNKNYYFFLSSFSLI